MGWVKLILDSEFMGAFGRFNARLNPAVSFQTSPLKTTKMSNYPDSQGLFRHGKQGFGQYGHPPHAAKRIVLKAGFGRELSHGSDGQKSHRIDHSITSPITPRNMQNQHKTKLAYRKQRFPGLGIVRHDLILFQVHPGTWGAQSQPKAQE